MVDRDLLPPTSWKSRVVVERSSLWSKRREKSQGLYDHRRYRNTSSDVITSCKYIPPVIPLSPPTKAQLSSQLRASSPVAEAQNTRTPLTNFPTSPTSLTSLTRVSERVSCRRPMAPGKFENKRLYYR